jgi:PAS domain S-box-containing protein
MLDSTSPMPFPLSVMDDAPTAVLLFDQDWRYLYVNRAAAEQLGTTVEALMGKVIWEVFPESVGGPYWDQLHAAARDGRTPTVETFYAPLGKWYRVDAFRTPVGVAVFIADTTAAHRVLDDLEASRRDLAESQRIAMVGTWKWDVASGAVQWSDETYRLFGLDPSFKPSFERIADVVHPDDYPRMTDALQAALRGEAPYNLDLRILQPGGPPKLVHVTGEVLRDAHGVPTGMLGTMQDVTQVRRADLALSESRQLLARVSKIAGIAAWSADVATGEVHWEPENWALWGLDPDGYQPSTQAMLERIVEEDRAPFAEVTRKVAAGRGPVSFDIAFRARHGSGELRHFRAVGELVRDAKTGTPVRLLGLTMDETERVRAAEDRRQMDAKLQQAQRLESLGVLAGGIAHDFNNLLVGILGNASLALADVPPGDPLRDPLLGIELSAQRAADLTRQLLAYSGKGRFVIERVDLTRLVEEMASLLEAALSKKAELRLALKTGLPVVDADATQLRQVVMNLLTNASEALGDAPGEIVVRTGVQRVDDAYAERTVDGATIAPGEYVFLEVADTGHGIPAADIARIFEPFYTTKFTGRGLGLAATLGIVRGHRGGIKVYSEVGRGTTFKVLLPAVEGESTPAGGTSATRAFVATGVAMIVDDEPSVRAVTRTMLVRRGFEVLEAAHGEEALALFEAEHRRISLVLLDLTMPRLDGEEVFRRLKAIDPSVRVIMMSGYNEQNVTQLFVGKGLAGFIQKPFRAADLYERIADAFGTS